SLSYATKLAGAGENDGALFMLDLAIPDLDRLTSIEERHDLVATLATALVTKGTVMSRLGDEATSRPFFQRANALMAPAGRGDPGRNAVFRWVMNEYVNRAKEEDRAGRHRSAAALFGQAVTLLEQLVNNEGRYELGAELAKALVGQAHALTQIGRG